MKLEGHHFKAGCSVCGSCMWLGSSQLFSGEAEVFCGQMGKRLEQRTNSKHKSPETGSKLVFEDLGGVLDREMKPSVRLSSVQAGSWAKEGAGVFLGMYGPGCPVDRACKANKGQQGGCCLSQDKDTEIGSLRG